jgi:hypothetical protein
VFLSFEPENPNAPVVPGQPVTLRVPATRFVSNRLEGEYEGTTWSIGQNTVLRIGYSDYWANAPATNPAVGPEGRENVSVTQVPTFQQAAGANPAYGTVTVTPNRRHYRGEAMLVTPNPAASPGTSGPVSNFNHRAPLFSGVVRYYAELR